MVAFCDGDIFPRFSCCVARAFAFAACARSGIGYFRCAVRPKAAAGNWRRCCALNTAIWFTPRLVGLAHPNHRGPELRGQGRHHPWRRRRKFMAGLGSIIAADLDFVCATHARCLGGDADAVRSRQTRTERYRVRRLGDICFCACGSRLTLRGWTVQTKKPAPFGSGLWRHSGESQVTKRLP